MIALFINHSFALAITKHHVFIYTMAYDTRHTTQWWTIKYECISLSFRGHKIIPPQSLSFHRKLFISKHTLKTPFAYPWHTVSSLIVRSTILF
jgi:hypothetical protein